MICIGYVNFDTRESFVCFFQSICQFVYAQDNSKSCQILIGFFRID